MPFSTGSHPPWVATERALASRDAVAVAGIEMHVGDQNRQQHEIGENDDRDPNARGDRHLADDLDRDGEDRDEADEVRQERHDRRQEQQPERAPEPASPTQQQRQRCCQTFPLHPGFQRPASALEARRLSDVRTSVPNLSRRAHSSVG